MVRLIEKYLTEDIEAVRRQYSYIPEDEFDKIIRLDPTFDENRDSVGKYGKWLLGLYKKETGNGMTYGDWFRGVGQMFTQTLQQYDKIRNDRTKIIEKDIMKFKTFQDLLRALENVKEAELSDKQKQRQAKKDKEYDLVFSGDIYDVYVPRNHAGNLALASFGGSKKATWCTAAAGEMGELTMAII